MILTTTMNKLTDFYTQKAALQKNGEIVSAEWDALEERLIHEEIMPELLQQLKATLSLVKCPLMLNVSYDPNGALAVSFTRNCVQTILPQTSITSTSATETHQSESIQEEAPDDEPLFGDTQTEQPKDVPSGVNINESVDDDVNVNESTHEEDRVTRSKSVGFRVAFPDGTVIQERKAVKTFIMALQKIGLRRISNGNHGIQHAGYNVVSTEKRESDTKKQELVDGFYIYTHMSNGDKIDDLNRLSQYYNLGLKISNDGIENEEPTPLPTVDEESKMWAYPMKQQFRSYMCKHIAERTADSYISTLDNAVRKHIHDLIDENADSVYAYTDPEDVRLCIDLLKSSDTFIQDNARRHNSMTAALNQYLQFVVEREESLSKE